MIGEIETQIRAGRWLDARHLAEQFLQVQPGNTRAHAYLGLTYYRTGEFEQAVAPLQKAIILDGQFWEAGTMLAQALDRLLRFDEALEVVEQFLVVRPSDPTLVRLKEGLLRNVAPKITDSWQKSTKLDHHRVELTHRDGQ